MNWFSIWSTQWHWWTNSINYLPSFSFANNGCINRYYFTFTYGQEILELKMNTFNLEKNESDTLQVDV